MNGLPYYKAYPRDFVEGTIGMRFELKGAYRLILDLIYMQSGKLPDDARYISGLLGCSVKKWNALRSELLSLGKIVCEGGVLTNLRAITELETLGRFQDKQSANASGPRKINNLPEPRLIHTESDIIKKESTPTVPKGTGRVRKANGHDPKLYEEFEKSVWSEFPRHPNSRKDPAFKKYSDLPQELRAKCIGGVARYSQRFDDTVDPKRTNQERLNFVPHLVTWINQKGWESEYEKGQ